MHWAKMQFEQGSSVTNYKGIFHTENGGTFDGTKVVNVTSGALAAGGGGGASMYNNAASSTFYWTVPGFGGGGAVFTQSGSANHCHGGHGAGQTPGSSMILQGYAGSTNSAVPVMFQYGLPCPWGRGGNGLYITTSSTATIPGDGGIAPGASPEGYGAGGGGGIALSSSANIYMSPPQVGPGAGFSGFNNGTFTTVKGGHGTPNTGAGGGGGASYAGATVAPGGNGGSGIITISYWGY